LNTNLTLSVDLKAHPPAAEQRPNGREALYDERLSRYGRGR
jgi:hypothetical protein